MPSPPTTAVEEPPRILDDTPVEVAVIGSGVCGVLAAAALRQRDGARVRVLEAAPRGGGVWRTTANRYSTLQVLVFPYLSLSLSLSLSSFLMEKKERRERREARLLSKRRRWKKKKTVGKKSF
jgi:cation diffusion facilitator CzcD-associated flavoprotein CzcO